MGAVADALVVCISNEGDADSVVLHQEFDAALEFVETGQGDSRAFMAAWSAPLGTDPTDLEALAYANPLLGHRIPPDALLGEAMTARRAGGETLARFKIERMCQRVELLDAAIDPERWRACGTDTPLDLAGHRNRVALCFDVSLDGMHATLMAAATVEGVTHLEVVKAWEGYGCTRALRRELPALVEKIKPRTLGWFPGGPAASVAAAMGERAFPRRVEVQELNAEAIPRVCMGLAEQVGAQQVSHPRDPLLDSQVSQTQKLPRGDGAWVFTRKGSGTIDASYAAAGAVHLARTLKPRVELAVASV
jgi:hypothetical protein